MRVTLKISLVDSPRPPFRHTLDLYNDTQLEKFIRKVAERLEIGTSVIAASLADLTAQLESYRLQRIEQKQEKKKKNNNNEEETSAIRRSYRGKAAPPAAAAAAATEKRR